MSFLEKWWARLRQQRQDLPSTVPFATEPIRRPSAQAQRYFQWQQHPHCLQLCQDLYEAYRAKQAGEPHPRYAVHLLASPYANGFALTFPDSMDPLHFQHLFDWLKDRTLLQGYRCVTAERRLFDRGSHVEAQERYYLKPQPAPDAPDAIPIDQRYGNVLLQLVQLDQQPSYLKLVASVYSDRLYTLPLDFQQLMRELFSAE
jgi:hypothetical protein